MFDGCSSPRAPHLSRIRADERIKDNGRKIREAFRLDERAGIPESMPGMGPVLGAGFVAIAGATPTP